MAQFLTEDIPDFLQPYKGRLSPRFYEIRKKLQTFIYEVIIPNNKVYKRQRQQLIRKTIKEGLHPLKAPQPPILKELQAEAKKRGLWNFFLPEVCGLTVLEYAPIAEMLGAFPLTNAAMNCSAPDTGNMEVLEKFGSREQKERWLKPLLNAEIRSCFAMTEVGIVFIDSDIDSVDDDIDIDFVDD